MTDINQLKPRLKEYLSAKGIQIVNKNGAMRIHCPHPDHPDLEETAIFYDTNIHCPICGTTWDIFEVAGLICNLHTFPEKINEVKKTLNIPIDKPEKKKYVAISYEKAKKIFTSEKLLSMCEYVGKNISKNNGDNPVKIGKEAMRLAWGDRITGAWPYRNKDGLVELVDVRFEGTEKKTVISFYYNGKNVKCSKPPILLLNRDKLFNNPTTPRLIHEGAKCAKIAEEKLSGFIHTTWNGGGAKPRYIDFTPIGNQADIYIYPDDDQKKSKPPEQQPGIKTAIAIQKKIKLQLGIDAKIIKPYLKAREIKPDGADIVEALQVATPEELTEYILSSPGMEFNIQSVPPKKNDDISMPAGGNTDSIPFRILGIAESGYAYYIDFSKRIFRMKLESLTKKSLLRIAPLIFWQNNFQDGHVMSTADWDSAIDWLIQKTAPCDFNPDDILGRGAWKNKDGSFCYWEGEKLIGKADPDKIFERKEQKTLGLEDQSASNELCQKMFDIVKQMTFETETDCIYFMAWCALSCFCGVLTYRPPILLTGESGTGKSVIFEQIARPLTLSFELTGSESSTAGCRQKNKNNSEGIIVEEDEDGYDDKKRKAFFALMRISFCENAPDAYKGSPGNNPLSFRMKNMFLFISISPLIEGIADDKRLFIVNLVKKNNDWEQIEKEMHKLFTEKNCRSVRARTWKKLHDIIDLSKKIKSILQKEIKLSPRRSHAEGLLIAAYYFIWHGMEKVNNEEINKIIKKMYELKPPVEERIQADELITRILDESVPVSSYSDKMTLREIIQSVFTGRKITGIESDPDGEEILSAKDIQNLKNIAGRYGLAVISNNLAIAVNHHEISKIIGMGIGYNRHFWRHPGCVEKSYPVYMGGITRRCVIITSVIDDIPF